MQKCIFGFMLAASITNAEFHIPSNRMQLTERAFQIMYQTGPVKHSKLEMRRNASLLFCAWFCSKKSAQPQNFFARRYVQQHDYDLWGAARKRRISQETRSKYDDKKKEGALLFDAFQTFMQEYGERNIDPLTFLLVAAGIPLVEGPDDASLHN